MKNIIIFTNMGSIEKHWQEALKDTEYDIVKFSDFKILMSFLDKYKDKKLILLFDEMSVHDIFSSLDELSKYQNTKTLLFNALPEVHHASTFSKIFTIHIRPTLYFLLNFRSIDSIHLLKQIPIF
jgi:hypothetical protein